MRIGAIALLCALACAACGILDPLTGGQDPRLASSETFPKSSVGRWVACDPGVNTDDCPEEAGSAGMQYALFIPTHWHAEESKLPLIVYLHGAGHRGKQVELTVSAETGPKTIGKNLERLFGKNGLLKPLEKETAHLTEVASGPLGALTEGGAVVVLVPQCPDAKGKRPRWADNCPFGTTGDCFNNEEFNNWNKDQYTADDESDHSTYVRKDKQTEQMAQAWAIIDAVADEYSDGQNYLVGDSMGAFGVTDLLSRVCAPNECMFTAAVAVAGGHDPSSANQYASVPIWLAHSDEDIGVPPSGTRALEAALSERNPQAKPVSWIKLEKTEKDQAAQVHSAFETTRADQWQAERWRYMFYAHGIIIGRFWDEYGDTVREWLLSHGQRTKGGSQ